MAKVDFSVSDQGTIVLLTPLTDAAHDWVKEHIAEDAQTWSRSIVIEHRFAYDILNGILNDGLTVKWGNKVIKGQRMNINGEVYSTWAHTITKDEVEFSATSKTGSLAMIIRVPRHWFEHENTVLNMDGLRIEKLPLDTE